MLSIFKPDTATALLLITFAPLLSTASTPVRVELFADAARVTRALTHEVMEPGAGTIRLTGLPLDLDRAAIRAVVVEGEPLRWERVEYGQARPDAPYVTPELERLRAELRELEAAHTAWNDELGAQRERLEHRKAVLDSLRAGLTRNPAAEVLAAIETAHAAFTATRTEVEMALRAAEGERPERERQLQAKRQAVARAEQTARALAGEIVLGFAAASPGPRRIEVQYLVPGARWSPQYRVRADSAAGRVEWEWLAEIRQSTREDWDGVEITLSTSPGRGGGDVAEVPPVILEPYQQFIVSAPLKQRSAMMGMEMAAPSPEPVVMAGLTQFQVRLPGGQRVPGDGSAVLLPVFREVFAARLWSEAAPLVEPVAYLRAELVNAFPAPLLPGATELYVDGVRTGQGSVELVLPGATFELGLGRNGNLKIERKTLVHNSRTRGMIGRSRVHERSYETSVESRMAVAHPVRLRDRFPVARDAKIEVRREAPANVEVDPETGRFTWATSVEPGKTVSYRTTFTVTHPDDMAVPTEF